MLLSSDINVLLNFSPLPAWFDKLTTSRRAPFPMNGRKGETQGFPNLLRPFMGEMPGGQRGRKVLKYKYCRREKNV